MHRWQKCPGSVRLSRGLPPTSNAAADAGTRAHELCAHILQKKKTFEEILVDLDLDPAAILSYVTIIELERSTANYFWIEEEFRFPELHQGFFGTSDAVGYWAQEKLLRVYDFKYGSGHFVEVEENVQLLYYALGAVSKFSWLEIENVEVAIIQPRCARKGKIDHRWKFKFDALIDFALEFKRAAKRTEDPNAPVVEGPYCYFCPAVTFCPAQHSKRNERAKEQFSEWQEAT